MVNSSQHMIRLAGGLILIQLTAAIVSHSIIMEPILFGSNDFLKDIYINSTKVRIASILDFMVGAAWFGASVLFFPVLKKYHERIALWFVGIRLAEFVTLIIGGILILSLVYISKKFENANEVELSVLQSLGEVIRFARGSTQNLSLLTYSIGSGLFFYLMLRTKLIPPALSILGLIGIVGLLTEILMSIFGFSTASFAYIILMPMGISEILLGIWLIAKGFKTE